MAKIKQPILWKLKFFFSDLHMW